VRQETSASSVWNKRSARRCPTGRLPRLSRPCRRCAASIYAAVAVLAEIGDLPRFQNPRELMGYPATRSSAAASPRPATVEHGASQSKQPGPIGILRVQAKTSSRRWQPHRGVSGRSRGRPKSGYAGASAHCCARARCHRWPPRPLPASSRPSFGRSIARSWHGGISLTVCPSWAISRPQ
jgi:hypothetical protein